LRERARKLIAEARQGITNAIPWTSLDSPTTQNNNNNISSHINNINNNYTLNTAINNANLNNNKISWSRRGINTFSNLIYFIFKLKLPEILLHLKQNLNKDSVFAIKEKKIQRN
jgi:hypothetical protein